MESKDIAQLVVSAVAPFVAAAGALGVAALGRRERVSAVISWGINHQYDDVSFVVVHNRSSHTIAITAVRYLNGVVWRSAENGTALDYGDPTDLKFPYLVEPGKLLTLRLDDSAAKRIATSYSRSRYWLAWVLRRSRFLVECQSTAGARYRTSGEPILPWNDQLPWRRGK